ncbi:ABC transporter permease [Nucisporomicrobium flavum]|uniref:ABC transporter permease n=1 Tax=Nucisporomicrobium flavum TaxID=2785915 RepID=UPI0027DCF35B|nr:ABC transporter permease [Nucisporomicrobium flavum]
MLSSRSFVIAGSGIRLLLADPAPFILTILMPLLLTAFLSPASKAQLSLSGHANASGAQQLIPGLGVLFTLLGTSLVGTLFFREHAWGTWERLRSSSASTLDIVIGKVAPLYVVQLGQMAVLFVAGVLVFGYRPNGSILALVVVLAVFVAMVAAFGVMLVALFATMDQALVVGNLGGMLMGGIGGALAPTSTLPGWLQAVAHISPAYWAIAALQKITLDHGNLGDVAGSLLVMALFGLSFALVAGLRFRPSDTKVGTT